MDFFIWVQVLTICLIGAVSPGPSLAMVVKNTLNEGKKQGSLTALGHGLGIFFYAALVVSGLGIALSTFPELEIFISFAGIVLLFFLGFSTLINSSKAKAVLGWSPSTTFSDLIKLMVKLKVQL